MNAVLIHFASESNVFETEARKLGAVWRFRGGGRFSSSFRRFSSSFQGALLSRHNPPLPKTSRIKSLARWQI